MSWFEIIWNSLMMGLVTYFAAHAYRNSQDVSEVKAKLITARGRLDRLESDFHVHKTNTFRVNVKDIK